MRILKEIWQNILFYFHWINSALRKIKRPRLFCFLYGFCMFLHVFLNFFSVFSGGGVHAIFVCFLRGCVCVCVCAFMVFWGGSFKKNNERMKNDKWKKGCKEKERWDERKNERKNKKKKDNGEVRWIQWLWALKNSSHNCHFYTNDQATRWYVNEPKFARENETHTIPWDFEI